MGLPQPVSGSAKHSDRHMTTLPFGAWRAMGADPGRRNEDRKEEGAKRMTFARQKGGGTGYKLDTPHSVLRCSGKRPKSYRIK